MAQLEVIAVQRKHIKGDKECEGTVSSMLPRMQRRLFVDDPPRLLLFLPTLALRSVLFCAYELMHISLHKKNRPVGQFKCRRAPVVNVLRYRRGGPSRKEGRGNLEGVCR